MSDAARSLKMSPPSVELAFSRRRVLAAAAGAALLPSALAHAQEPAGSPGPVSPAETTDPAAFLDAVEPAIPAPPTNVVRGPDGRVLAFGELGTYRTVRGDTFSDLSQRFDFGYVQFKAANQAIDPWLPGVGTELVLPARYLLPDAPQHGVLINLAEMRMYWFAQPNADPLTFPVGIGREGLLTPTGATTVVRKTIGPVWRPTPRMRSEDPELPEAVYPGPDNPLGSHALYLGWPAYLMHGTNLPEGVGRRLSSGCIRMHNRHAAALYELAPVGTKVTVVDQPIKFAWLEDGQLWMQAHVSQAQADRLELEGEVPFMVDRGFSQMVLRVAGDRRDALDWSAIRDAIYRRSGVPVRITA